MGLLSNNMIFKKSWKNHKHKLALENYLMKLSTLVYLDNSLKRDEPIMIATYNGQTK